jgi:hypothetical protein
VPDLVTVPAVQVNARRIVAAGTVMWFVAFAVLLPFWSRLGHDHHRIWLWTCLAGGLLGLFGLTIMTRHRGMGRTI